MFFSVMSVKVNLLHLTRQTYCIECVTWRIEDQSLIGNLPHGFFLLLGLKFQFWIKKHSKFKMIAIQFIFTFVLRWNRFTLLVSLPSSPTAPVCPLGVSVSTVTTKVKNNLKLCADWKWTRPCCIVSLPLFSFNLLKWFVQSRRPAVAFLNKRSLQNNYMRHSLASRQCGAMLLSLFGIVPCKCICSHRSDKV